MDANGSRHVVIRVEAYGNIVKSTAMPPPAATAAAMNHTRRAPPKNSITPPIATIMIDAEKCGSKTKRPTIAASIAANGSMPYRKLFILPRRAQIIDAKASIMPIFAISDGWIVNAPKPIQRFAPFAFVPIIGTSMSRMTAAMRTGIENRL